MDERRQQEDKNKRIVEGLREVFAVLAQRLSAEVEPATTYQPADDCEDGE